MADLVNVNKNHSFTDNEQLFETFDVPDDFFYTYNPYEPWTNASSIGHYKSSGHDSKIGTRRNIESPLTTEDTSEVTGTLHCCRPIGLIKDGVRHIIPSCHPAFDKCDGGGTKELHLLTTEARVWWYFQGSEANMDTWFTYHHNKTYDQETTNWTIHFCKPAFMRKDGVTEAWPTCNPFKKECDGGKFPRDMIRRYEWACFNAHKRGTVEYEGIEFDDWVKVKFGDIELNKQVELIHKYEWAEVKFKDMERFPFDPTFWRNSSSNAQPGEDDNSSHH